MDSEKIKLFREKIDQINSELIQILNTRDLVISEIMQQKKTDSSEVWNIKREKEIFQNLLPYAKKTSNLKILSYMMEVQAKEYHRDYPCWSMGEHILEFGNSEFELMNPILLMLINKSEYQKLKCKPEFKQKLDSLDNE